MRPTDKTGRALGVGQLVDITMLGMFTGQIVEINDPKIAVPGMRTASPTVQVIVPVILPISPQNTCDNLYVVGEAPLQTQVKTGPRPIKVK